VRSGVPRRERRGIEDARDAAPLRARSCILNACVDEIERIMAKERARKRRQPVVV